MPPTFFDQDSPPLPRRRRRWVRRLTVAAGVLISVALLTAGATGLYLQRWYSGIDKVTITHATTTTETARDTSSSAAKTSTSTNKADSTSTSELPTTTATETPGSVNILVTGSDSRSCVDPHSPYAGAFLADGNNLGNRSDTIMVLHLDESNGSMAMLSLPRDLWVPIAGTAKKNRINTAFDPKNPSRLVQTIETDFGIRIDHYLGVDFCAFKDLVDAVGGVTVPFSAPTRDLHTGLDVTNPGCHVMRGDEALAYVRSRYFEQQVKGRWQMDPSSDYGRIARQQDFIRRVVAKAISVGATNPLTAKKLLDAAQGSNLRIDDQLGLGDMLRIGRDAQAIGVDNAVSYRLPGTGTTINGASVIQPDVTSPEALAILDVFRGGAPTITPASTTSAPVGTVPPTAGAKKTTKTSVHHGVGTTSTTTAATAPGGAPESNMQGVRPAGDQSC